MKSGLSLHCHHDTLWEYCHDYDEWVEFIKENKPKEERKLRLRLFQIPDQDLLPGKNSEEWDAFVKAGDACVKPWVAFVKARDAYNKASATLYKAGDAYTNKYSAQLGELHKQLCPACPWDGKTIFSIKGGE